MMPDAPASSPSGGSDVSLLSTLGAGLTGFLAGGPAGAAMGVATSIFGGGMTGPPRPPMPVPFGGGGGGAPSGGGGFFGSMNAQGDRWLQGQGIAPRQGSCPRGYHLNKHALSASKRHGAVAARSICVRNRSMNPLNPRAIARALRREKRARKLLQRLHVFRPAGSAVRRSSGGHRPGCGCVVCKRR